MVYNPCNTTSFHSLLNEKNMTQCLYVNKNGDTKRLTIEFQGESRFLSNFYPCKVTLPAEPEHDLPEMEFSSIENAYAAWKTTGGQIRKIIQSLSPKEAKELTYSKNFPLRPDLNDEDRLTIMEILVNQKYSDKNPELKQLLLSTGNATIIAGNDWNDTFFGFCLKKSFGLNHLGRLTAQRRGLRSTR